MANVDYNYEYGKYNFSENNSITVDPKVEGVLPKEISGYYSLLDETRDWRVAIKQHVTNEHNQTREHVTNEHNVTKEWITTEDNRVRDELETWIENDHDTTRTEINSNTNSRATEIKTAIDNSKSSVISQINTKTNELGGKIDGVQTTANSNNSLLNNIWNKIRSWSI